MVRIEETVVGTGPVVPRLSNVIAAADYSVWLQKGYSPIKLGGIHAVAALLPTIPHFLLNVMILHYHPGKGPLRRGHGPQATPASALPPVQPPVPPSPPVPLPPEVPLQPAQQASPPLQ